MVSQDVLEHVPEPRRAAWLAEAWRVTGDLFLLGVPFASAGVAAADQALRDLIARDYGYDHTFLAEHLDLGHPSLTETEKFFLDREASVTVLASGYLPVWEIAQLISARLSHPGQGVEWLTANREINGAFGLRAACEPAYRHLLIIDRHARDLQEVVADLSAHGVPDLEPLLRLRDTLPQSRMPSSAWKDS